MSPVVTFSDKTWACKRLNKSCYITQANIYSHIHMMYKGTLCINDNTRPTSHSWHISNNEINKCVVRNVSLIWWQFIMVECNRSLTNPTIGMLTVKYGALLNPPCGYKHVKHSLICIGNSFNEFVCFN